MNKAPYRWQGGKWFDMNSDLSIRNNKSFSSPTSSNVPIVNTWTGSKWEQIYPPVKQTVNPPIYQTDGLMFWQGNSDSGRDTKIWGWAYGSHGTNLASLGYFGTGPNHNERNVLQEYCGWIGIDKKRLNKDGYKGLGKVISVTKFTLYVTHSPNTGTPSLKRKFGIICSNVASPKDSNLANQIADKYNPCKASNRSSIVLSDISQSLVAGGESRWDFTSSSALNLIKDFLNGKWNAVFSFNGSGRGVTVNHTPDGQYSYSSDYQKISKIRYKIEYTYTP